MNSIGILQGRLSSPGGYEQLFPFRTWELEFEHASRIGFACIEWLFAGSSVDNPIWSRHGRERIRRLMESTGIRIPTVCAHYFMDHPLHGVADELKTSSITILEELLERSSEIGVETVLLPVLERSSLRNEADPADLQVALIGPLRRAKALGIRLALEVDLTGRDTLDILSGMGGHPPGIYFDTGNATAKGLDPAHEILVLNDHIVGVHLKDRLRGGASVPLGSGDTDLRGCLKALNAVAYRGPLILEANRGTDPIAQAQKDLALVRQLLVSERSEP